MIGLTGKLGRALVGAWVSAWVVHGCMGGGGGGDCVGVGQNACVYSC